MVEATAPDGRKAGATAYQPAVVSRSSLTIYGSRQFTVDIIFPAVQPAPPAPKVQIRVFRKLNGKRVDIGGFAATGEELIIGLEYPEGGDVGRPIVEHAGALEELPKGFDTAPPDEPRASKGEMSRRSAGFPLRIAAPKRGGESHA